MNEIYFKYDLNMIIKIVQKPSLQKEYRNAFIMKEQSEGWQHFDNFFIKQLRQ